MTETAGATSAGMTPDETGHRHDRHCYWDVWECGWVCGPRTAAEPAPAEPGVPAGPPSFAVAR